ncbi:MAG TPA: DUF1490 family protein [Mycobacterium sp.]|nr:DUF1490 family protein [Mycobacterium sp.]
MAWHGLAAKAVPMTVTGVMGAAAYEALRRALAKAPLRKATVVATAWGIRVAREVERKAQTGAEQARLTVADVMAEAKERAGEDVSPLTNTASGDDHGR